MLTDRIRKTLRCFMIAVVVVFAFSCAVYADQTVNLGDFGIKSGDDITDVFNMVAERKDDSETGRVRRRVNGEEVPYEAGVLTIVIPAGDYTVGGGEYPQLKIWGNTSVQMEGVTLTRNSSASMLRFGSKDFDWDNANGGKGRPGYDPVFSNISFEGGTWDGGAVQRSIMQMGHASNLSFTNVTFKNVRQSHYLEFGACKTVRITGCTFSDYVGDFGNTYNGEAVQFEILSGAGIKSNEHFDGYNPIDDETICQDVEITGCTFERLKRGIGSHTAIANSYFENFQIHHNTFKDITGYAVSMMNYKNSSVHDNVIEGCGCGIQVAASERSHRNFYSSKNKSQNSRKSPEKLNVQVYKNTLVINAGANGKNYNNVNFGIWVFGEKLDKKTGTMPAGDWRASGVTVKDNKIAMNVAGGTSGIWLTGTKGCKVLNNEITCNFAKKGKGSGQESGIRLEESQNDEIKGNTITNKSKKGFGKTFIGIQIKKPQDSKKDKSKGAKIIGNKVYNCALYGFKVEYASNIVFQKNTIKDTGISATKGDGVKVDDASDIVIDKNTIEGTTRDGIKLDKAKGITITGNTIKKQKRYGIFGEKKMTKKVKSNKIAGDKKKQIRLT